MPIYTFWCPRCGKRFDKMRDRRFGGLPANCPKCGGKAIQRPSTFGFQFKPALR